MITILHGFHIPDNEIRFDAIRAQGAGGQNVNKVSSAVHLRFDVGASSLPPEIKEKILALRDQRISKEGIIVIKAQQFRNREKNKDDAVHRLEALISRALEKQTRRKPTKPSKAAKQKRLESKTRKGRIKQLRGRVSSLD